MKIAITGASGHVGRKVVDILLRQGGHDLVLLSRRPETLAEETNRGAAVMQGDLQDGPFVRRATQGVDELFYMIPPRPDAENLRAYQNVVAQNGADAVRANDIDRVVLLSSMGAQAAVGNGPVDGLHDAESLMRAAAPNVTVLRPGLYMENFLMSFEGIARARSIFLPIAATTRVAMIATKDVADAAARALTDASWSGARVVSLLGPRDYGFEDAARILGKAIGMDLRYVKISRNQARDFLMSLGMSESVAAAYAQMEVAIDSGKMRPERPRNAESTTPTTLDQFARDVFAPAYRDAVRALAQPVRM